MKKILSLVPLCLLAALAVADTQVRLAWDPNPESEGVTSYVLEYWPGNSTTRQFTNAGNSTGVVVTITDAVPWTFRVRAANASGTSSPSTEVRLQVRPTAPKGLSATISLTNGEVRALAR